MSVSLFSFHPTWKCLTWLPAVIWGGGRESSWHQFWAAGENGKSWLLGFVSLGLMCPGASALEGEKNPHFNTRTRGHSCLYVLVKAILSPDLSWAARSMPAVTQCRSDRAPVTILAPASESGGAPDRNQDVLSGSSFIHSASICWVPTMCKTLFWALFMGVNKSDQKPCPHSNGERDNELVNK